MGGAFSKVLGTKGLGLTGTTSESEQQTKLDPTTAAMNRFRFSQLQNPDLWNQYQDVYSMGDTSQSSLDRLMGSTGSWLNLNDWQGQARQDTSTAAARDWLNQYTGSGEDRARQTLQDRLQYGTQSAQQGRDDWLSTGKQDINSWLQNYLGTGKQDLQNTFQNYYGTGTQNLESTLGRELAAYGGIQNQMVGAGNNYMQQILGPQLGNQYALMGLARSGGRQEAEAKGAANIGLDIGQMMGQLTSGAYGRYGQGQQNLTNQAYGQLNEGLNTLNNAAYGQAGQQTSNLNNAAHGQFNDIIAQLNQAGYSDLGQQLQQLWNTNYAGQSALQSQESSQLNSLNQMVPQAYENQQNAQFGRQQAAFNASLTPQQWRQQGLNDWRNTYLSGLGATPYTPATTIKTKGDKNEGILDSAIAGGVGAGGGAGAAKALFGG